MNIANIKYPDIANGIGCRVSLFVSGCEFYCKGCFNKEAWSFSYGSPYDNSIDNKLMNILSKTYIKGLTILGGEPLHPKNIKSVLKIIQTVKTKFPNKDIWVYTGYTYEELETHPNKKDIIQTLQLIDILVDGRFKEELSDKTLKFKGSRNQRIIDVKKSREKNQIIELM